MPEPSTETLTEFPEAPENPLSQGGKWQYTSVARPPLQLDAFHRATDSVHGFPNYSHWVRDQYHTPTDPDEQLEVFGCTFGGQLGAALETWRVAIWFSTGGSLTGYQVYQGGSVIKQYVIRRYDGDVNTPSDLVAVAGSYPDKLALVIAGDTLEAWAYEGGVWVLKTSVDDTTYRGACYLGLGIEDPTGGGLAFGCFGGGVTRRTQFFRWTRGTR